MTMQVLDAEPNGFSSLQFDPSIFSSLSLRQPSRRRR